MLQCNLQRGLILAMFALATVLLVKPATAEDLGAGLSQPASVYRPVTRAESAIVEHDAVPATLNAGVTPNALPEKPLPLAPPSERQGRELTAPRMPGDSSTVTTIVTSLGVVLGLFFIMAWFLRRNLPKGMTLLPGEVLEQLGRAPLAGKQNMHLVRVGHKLVLLVVTPFGAETLTEVTDPDEVARLCGLCRKHGSHGPSAEFRDVLKQFEREPAGPGFLGDTARSDRELANAGRTTNRTRGRGSFDA